MKRYWVPGLCGVLSVLFTAGGVVPEAAAQIAAAETHVAAARAAATRPGHDFSFVFDRLCKEINPADAVDPAARGPVARRTPPRSDWFREPTKIFDNLYFIGSDGEPGWVVTTSAGIILIDTTDSYAVEEQADKNLRKLGLNPADIKYILVTAAHTDHYAGAPYLITRYHPRIVMSAADWNVVETSNLPSEIKPKRDIVATDGMKITVGDTTITLHVTPGHTPGTVSMLVPLKDGNQRHLGGLWGGLGFGFDRDGARYFPNTRAMLEAYSSSMKRWKAIEEQAGVDVIMGNHTNADKGLEKMAALAKRQPGQPHPFVSREAVSRFATVFASCADAQLAWMRR
jgi:metallo-beta-lactamase class B